MKKALDYFTDDPSVPLSCTAHCLRCILSRYHRWLQLTLAAWRKETNILFFNCLVKQFIRDYEIITSLGQEGVGLETGPSSFACACHLGPKLPAFACCLFTMKNETGTFSLVTFTRNGYTHPKKLLCLFLKMDTEELFLMSDGTVFQSVGAANVLKLKSGIEKRFLDDERSWRDGMVPLRSNFVTLFARSGNHDWEILWNNLQCNSKLFDFVLVFLALETSCWIKTLQYFVRIKIIYTLS